MKLDLYRTLGTQLGDSIVLIALYIFRFCSFFFGKNAQAVNLKQKVNNLRKLNSFLLSCGIDYSDVLEESDKIFGELFVAADDY